MMFFIAPFSCLDTYSKDEILERYVVNLYINQETYRLLCVLLTTKCIKQNHTFKWGSCLSVRFSEC